MYSLFTSQEIYLSNENLKQILKNVKFRKIVRHNLVNIAVFFIIKIFSYIFIKQSILFSNILSSSKDDVVFASQSVM